jgi:hypothetical protein
MSVISNQSFSDSVTPFFNPLTASGIFTWPAINNSTTATITVPNVKATSVVLATIDVDDQQGSGICWIVTSTPSANTITITLAAAASASSTLRISWMVARY